MENVVHKQRHKKESDINVNKVHCDVCRKEKKELKDIIKHVLPKA